MREKAVERKLVEAVKARGGICPKWVSPGFDGVPDRLVFLPGRHSGCMSWMTWSRLKKYLMRLEVMPYEVHTTRIPEICD
jgi:hypothetical protein